MTNDLSEKQDAKSLSIETIREDFVGVGARVPLLGGAHHKYVNFDNAASTPALRPVFDTVNRFMHCYSSVHRGTGFKSQVSTWAYERAHEIVCEFLGADPEAQTVIFGKNSTEALNKLAHRLMFDERDVVLTTVMEHHSNDLPWRDVAEVKHIRVNSEGALDESHLDDLLAANSDRVRLVAVTGASNVTGYLPPIHRIAEKAHAVGAEILVDAAQLAPHRPIDIMPADEAKRIDYLVLSAHKMYAPYGTGALVGSRDCFEKGRPDLVGGGTVDIVTLDRVAWADLPEKEEAGSPNVVGAVALGQAMLSLQEIGLEAIISHEASLTRYLLSHLNRMERVQVYGISDPERVAERLGVVSFAVEGMSHYLVAAILSAEGGIGVRNGCFCAHPYLLSLLQITPSEANVYQQGILQNDRRNTPGLVRVSFGCYNTKSEVDRFINVLERIVDGEYEGHYVQDPVTGEYWPEGYSVDLNRYFSYRYDRGQSWPFEETDEEKRKQGLQT
jgi:selenocysteine lyase/cysteine desulfurase